MIGPPNSTLGFQATTPFTSNTVYRFTRRLGSRLLTWTFQSSPARRVWIITRPDENLPNSTSYGFDMTEIESMPSAGSETRDRLVAGSTSVADPICWLVWFGRAPSMLFPRLSSMTPGVRRTAVWMPSPGESNWVSLLSTVSVVASESDVDTTVRATTSTCSVNAIGRSSASVTVAPAATVAAISTG